jgi:chemotaxis response regulator CheB
MPRACAESGVLHSVLGLDSIPGEIVRILEAGSATLPREAITSA